MNTAKLILLLFSISLISCNADQNSLEIRLGETLMENRGLKDSIATLNAKLKDYKLTYSFSSIRPTIIPKDTLFKVKNKSTFYIINDARSLRWDHKPYKLEYELNSTLQSKMSWYQEDENWEHTLSYIPQKKGRDTLTVWFHFQDPDSLQSIRLPAKYIIDVK